MSCSDVNAPHCMNSCAAYGKICPYVARLACQYASQAVETLKKDSLLFSSVVQDGGDRGASDADDDAGPTSSSGCGSSCFTRIAASDIRILEKLGEGGFSNVNRCLVKINNKTKNKTTASQVVVEGAKEEEAAPTTSTDATTATETSTTGTQTTSVVATRSSSSSSSSSPVTQAEQEQATLEEQHEQHEEEHEEEHEFAVKYLRRKAMMELHQFKHGAADLVCEAYFLQALRHPNIVSLHGISAAPAPAPAPAEFGHNSHHSNDSCSNSSSKRSCNNNSMVDSFAWAATAAASSSAVGHANNNNNNNNKNHHRDTAEHCFFIVIDKLSDTLENKIHEWKCEREKHSQLQYSNLLILSRLTNPLFAQHHNDKAQKRAQLLERVQIALDIAHAMEYLHSLNIIFVSPQSVHTNSTLSSETRQKANSP
jgi:serine/threonine protein kinase